MRGDSSQLIVVFPIATSAFGLRADWFETFTPKLVSPTYLLLTMLMLISLGIMALRRFENANFERRVWNFPVLMTVIVFWPALVLGLKDIIDAFNTFLVIDIFRMPWKGFGFPDIGSFTGLISLPSEGLARLLPNLAYWIVYAFYIIFFFFYAVLGPFVLAKGVLFDEVQTFLELVKELSLLFLWQTTLVVLVAFIMPEIVSGQAFPPHPQANFYFLSLILGVMIFFVPTLTRKFGSHLEGAFVPLGFRWGGAALGITAIGKLTSATMSTAGVSLSGAESLQPWKTAAFKGEEFKTRYNNRTKVEELDHDRQNLERKLHEDYEAEHSIREVLSDLPGGHPVGLRGSEAEDAHRKKDALLHLAKKAKSEMREDGLPET